MKLHQKYRTVRERTEDICQTLKTEDYVVQPVVDVSPPKWHLGHTTWFFETFILKPYSPGYAEFDPGYNFVFNSYYETVGARVIRTDRGNLSRPTVEDVYRYRRHVDDAMQNFITEALPDVYRDLIILGLNHEQQHQELLATDIKYILGHNPLFPSFRELETTKASTTVRAEMLQVNEGVYEIGSEGDGFCFDNELKRHKVYIPEFQISNVLVTNAEYLQFINDGGYGMHQYWHAEGLEWIKTNKVTAPLYWHFIDGQWFHYTPHGLVPLNTHDELCHISFYEAAAYAAYRSMRLPTEFEWEVAAQHFNWGRRWEWTNSAYLPYPGFTRAEGAIGEYNGKFMVNQMVLRGGSSVTPEGHSRISYRNFFHPHLRWQYTGIRLAG